MIAYRMPRQLQIKFIWIFAHVIKYDWRPVLEIKDSRIFSLRNRIFVLFLSFLVTYMYRLHVYRISSKKAVRLFKTSKFSNIKTN